jgi:uncharacterized protein
MTSDDLMNDHPSLLLKCISGSRAYGLHTEQSDTDYKGLFIAPPDLFYGFSCPAQVNNESNDILFYEWRKFMELLLKNNPAILELLATPDDCVLYRHPLMDSIRPEYYLSKLCSQTFAGYAQSQIKKARGLNKKISNPVAPERKTIPDFCHVVEEVSVRPLKDWLLENGYRDADCGLVKIPNMRDLYAVFHSSQTGTALRGIYSGEDANDVSLSFIPKGIKPLALMSFNKDAYSVHCKDYRNYWEWVSERNQVRYENTVSHGRNYDAKNMMHTFRLLNMAEEIAREGKIVVRRADRDFLLQIRNGHFEYDDLLAMAVEKTARIDELFRQSDLPDEPDALRLEALLVGVRTEFYKGER